MSYFYVCRLPLFLYYHLISLQPLFHPLESCVYTYKTSLTSCHTQHIIDKLSHTQDIYIYKMSHTIYLHTRQNLGKIDYSLTIS